MKEKNMRILVTGGAGFIGSALIRHLILDLGHKVLNVDKLTYAGNLENLNLVENNENYSFIKEDICNTVEINKIINDFRPQYIMHLAAESHVDRSITGSDQFIKTNIMGTFVLLEAARLYWANLNIEEKNNFRFLHVSTDEVYGSLGAEGLFEETTAYDPSSPYSASKAASDHLVKAWNRTYGFPSIISNCSNNYGPYHFPEKLIPLNIINALEGKPITLYGNGENIRDWLYVEDHVRALYLICKSGQIGETYNVGGKNEKTNYEVVSRICMIFDNLFPDNAPHDKLITYVKDRPGHDARYAINATKLENELGWKALESFETGIEKTIIWYLNNRKWWQPLRNTIYDGERLGVIS